VRIGCLFEPLLILGNGEEVDPLFSFCNLPANSNAHSGVDDKGAYADNGCYKLHQEVRNFQQGWEEVVQEVDEESLYV
jgi:hypothetical protein